MRFAKILCAWFASFSGLAVPALAGAVVGAFRHNRRARTRGKLVATILMSATCGCGLTPLFAHVFGIPDPVASSLAFFLGFWGLEGLEIIQLMLRGTAGMPRPGKEGFTDGDKGEDGRG